MLKIIYNQFFEISVLTCDNSCNLNFASYFSGCVRKILFNIEIYIQKINWQIDRV